MSDDREFQFNKRQGLNEFEQAKRRVFFQRMLSLLRGKPVELLSFEDVRARLRLREELYRGRQNVPLDKIVGSVGRYRDFTRTFLPKRQAMEQRWANVYAQAVSMEGLPPVELYQVGDTYFVRDGNHRVSVAQRLGAKTIEAHVIELTTPISLGPDTSAHDLDAATPYAEFLDHTGLRHTRPDHLPLDLSEPSRYNDLLGHIHLHKCVSENADECNLSIQQAAAHWYDTVYEPLIDPICEYGIMRFFPDRTKADLYLWMVDHLCEMQADCEREHVRAEPLRAMLAGFLDERDIPVPQQLAS